MDGQEAVSILLLSSQAFASFGLLIMAARNHGK